MLAWHNTLINEVKIEHLISACRTITHDTIHNGAAFVYNKKPKIQKCKNHLIHSVLAIVWNSSKLFLFLYLTLYLYTYPVLMYCVFFFSGQFQRTVCDFICDNGDNNDWFSILQQWAFSALESNFSPKNRSDSKAIVIHFVVCISSHINYE